MPPKARLPLCKCGHSGSIHATDRKGASCARLVCNCQKYVPVTAGKIR